jgi:hypothetical protein
MLTFKAILANENIDPKKVRLVRHKDNSASGSFTPYNLWLAADGHRGLECHSEQFLKG